MAGLAVLAGLQVIGMALDWAMQSSEQAGIRQETRALALKALPAHAAVVDPAWQVREQLMELRATAAGGNQADSFLALIGRLGQSWPATGGATLKAVNYRANELELSFTAVQESWLEQLKAAALARQLSVTAKDKGAGQTTLLVSPVSAGVKQGERRHE
jgi:hypothetical protein